MQFLLNSCDFSYSIDELNILEQNDPNVKTKYGENILMLAAKNNDLALLIKLLFPLSA